MRYSGRTDHLAFSANTPAQEQYLPHSLKQAAVGIGINMNANKTEHMF